MAEPSSSTSENSYDFGFILRKPRPVKNAITALVDPRFNEQHLAVLQVGKAGFEITVQVTDSKTQNQVFGFLSLTSTALENFECQNPLRKTVCLKSFQRAIDEVVDLTNRSFAIFVVHGSNKLSFRLGKDGLDVGHAQPVSIELHDVKPEQETFPNVSYGFEAVIPSNTLFDTITEVLQMKPESRPTNGLVTMKAATVLIDVGGELKINTENEAQKHEVWMEWQYWESLQKATCSADECSMYLVVDPPEHIMFRFKLQKVGDLVYLTKANFLDVSELPDLGYFRSLLNI